MKPFGSNEGINTRRRKTTEVPLFSHSVLSKVAFWMVGQGLSALGMWRSLCDWKGYGSLELTKERKQGSLPKAVRERGAGWTTWSHFGWEAWEPGCGRAGRQGAVKS